MILWIRPSGRSSSRWTMIQPTKEAQNHIRIGVHTIKVSVRLIGGAGMRTRNRYCPLANGFSAEACGTPAPAEGMARSGITDRLVRSQRDIPAARPSTAAASVSGHIR